jgi:hypothetical protein
MIYVCQHCKEVYRRTDVPAAGGDVNSVSPGICPACLEERYTDPMELEVEVACSSGYVDYVGAAEAACPNCEGRKS